MYVVYTCTMDISSMKMLQNEKTIFRWKIIFFLHKKHFSATNTMNLNAIAWRMLEHWIWMCAQKDSKGSKEREGEFHLWKFRYRKKVISRKIGGSKIAHIGMPDNKQFSICVLYIIKGMDLAQYLSTCTRIVGIWNSRKADFRWSDTQNKRKQHSVTL